MPISYTSFAILLAAMTDIMISRPENRKIKNKIIVHNKIRFKGKDDEAVL